MINEISLLHQDREQIVMMMMVMGVVIPDKGETVKMLQRENARFIKER